MKIPIIALLLAAPFVSAFSTINSTEAYAYSANTGWIHLRPSATDGVSVSEYHLAGKAYGANSGWIDFGSAPPASGPVYSNANANDFGVNHDGAGNLSGYAYSANLGWINFGWAAANDINRPRFDPFTGRFYGYAYAANTGWILLGTTLLATDTIIRADSDHDGIGDEWELAYFGNLTTANRTTDSDHDGYNDLAEHLADTGPLNPADHPALSIPYSGIIAGNHQSTLQWISRPTRLYTLETSTSLLTGSWSFLGDFNGSGLTTTFDHLSGPDTKRFYRLSYKLPLP